MNCRGLRWVVVTLVVAVIGFVGGEAWAGILEDTLHAIPGFNGSRDYHAGPVIGNEITVEFDFAAFAPVASDATHSFDAFLAEYGITFDAAVPDDYYVYAYQVHALPTTSPGAGLITVGINRYSGELFGDGPSYIPLGVYGSGTGGNGNEAPATPTYQGTPTTSARWDYQGSLGAGEWTPIMFFASTNPPTWKSAQVNAGVVSGKSTLDYEHTGVPSPAVPEPSSLMMLGMGAVLVALWSRRRATR